MNSDIQNTIETAEGKALATYGVAGLNVVPISMARVVGDEVWLFDFFMGKTIKNIESANDVAVTAWAGLSGIQIKGTAIIHREGDVFEAGAAWVTEQNPDRVTRGVIVITPEKIFDISAGPDAGKEIK